MAKVDIFSGFLGAGKTTLIKKLISEAYAGEKLVLIENEFGEIGIDGGFLQEAGIEVTEMNSGCICCTLVGDFGQALLKVIAEHQPERILIEPSGVGKLSDVISAVQNVQAEGLELNAFVTVADATRCKMYMKNFGEFFDNQVAHAGTILLSRTEGMKEERLLDTVALLREKNPGATIVTTPWDALNGAQILETMERRDTLEHALAQLADATCSVCGHDHHGHEHHHAHGADCGCEHDHGHHHAHGADCGCGHDHHHHHDADEVFQSIGAETPRKFTKEELAKILEGLSDEKDYGMVLRAKGIVAGADSQWLHFDYVPGEADIRTGAAAVTGRFCIIGAALQGQALKTLFHIN